jgi:hypothetical protein
MLSRDFGQRQVHPDFIIRLFATTQIAKALACFFALFDFLLGLEFTTPKQVARCKSHSKMSRHRYYLSLEITQHDVPTPLVNAERYLSVGFGVGVGSTNNPGWRIGNTKVKKFSLLDKNVNPFHNLIDKGGVISPMHVQDINEVGP